MKRSRGLSVYFVVMLVLLALLVVPSFMDNNRIEYTRGELMNDLEAGRVVSADITPSRQTPTGEVTVTLESGLEKTLYVTDVSEIEQFLISFNIDPNVEKVQEENWFLTSILPMLVSVVVLIVFFTMMNGQSGGSNAKMMNFGKSRAKLSVGDGTITLKDVAGLQEEKEELEEIVEFLKDPAKFTKVGARIPKGVLLEGAPGTGKTLLTLAAGLTQTMEQRRFNEIIITRATISVGEDIGFLPGAEEEKMAPWLGAIDDNLEVLNRGSGNGSDWGRRASEDLIRSRIRIKSMSFMRGRTFLNKFVIIDEAQNLTPKQMKTLITRAGPGTKIVCLGNIAQIDTPYLTEGSSGLTYVVDRFKGWPHSGHITMQRGERSRLADFASDAL